MFQRTSKLLETVARVRDEMDDRLLLHPIRRQNRLTGDKKPHRDQAVNRKTHLIRVKFIPCRFEFCKKSVV